MLNSHMYQKPSTLRRWPAGRAFSRLRKFRCRDFVSPLEVTIPAGETALIPTGIRAEMEQGWVLLLFPRSSLGFRYSMRLANTVGVIDSDYAFAKNEGHIMVKLRNPLSGPVTIGRGERFCQGIFLPYGTAEEDEVTAGRVGGFGSTDG